MQPASICTPARAVPRRGFRTWTMLLLTLLAIVSTGAATASASIRTNAYGSISAVNGEQAQSLPSNQLAAQLNAMHNDGIQMVRADAAWATIQPNPPSAGNPGWQWATTDAWETALANHHLTWEPILDYAVGWAKTCSGFCAPSDNSTYATYAQAVAARYGPNGSFWASHPTLPYLPAQIFEIWNEENVSTFHVDPAEYDQLYLAARGAIHSVQPSVSVIVGGLADDSGTYNQSDDYASWYVVYMFSNDPGLVGNVDGWGLHPYGATALDVEQWTADFRHTLNYYGENSAPIDVTEFGWTTGTGARESWRATQMNTVALALGRSNCGIRTLAPYDWINPGAATSSDFGLVSSGGSSTALRPAGSSWLNGLLQAGSLAQLPLC